MRQGNANARCQAASSGEREAAGITADLSLQIMHLESLPLSRYKWNPTGLEAHEGDKAHIVLGESGVKDGELRDLAVEAAAGKVVRAVAEHDGAVSVDGPTTVDLEEVLWRRQRRPVDAVHIQAEALPQGVTNRQSSLTH